MICKKILCVAGLLTAAFVCRLAAGDGKPLSDELIQGPTQWEMKLRVLEGVKEGIGEPAKAVTASYLRYTATVGLFSNGELSEEQEQIRKIFNLKEVRLLTEADLVRAAGKTGRTSHTFRLDGHEYIVRVTTERNTRWQPFGIEVIENTEKGETSLLDTGFGFPNKFNRPIVFGFENTQGRPFFVSVHAVELKASSVESNTETVDLKRRLTEFEKGAVPVKEGVPVPKLIKRVDPVYPEEARKNKIQGIVILEAKIDEAGRVFDVIVLKSVPELDRSAVDGVRQWMYEPLLVGGKAVKAVFTVTVKFALDGEKAKGGVGGVKGVVKEGVEDGVAGGVGSEEWEKRLKAFEAGAVPCKDEINPPKLIKLVNPVYPEKARKQGLEGIVILSAKTDENGKVIDTMVLRSIPGLDQAAMDALKQWVYEPLLIDGKPRKVIFTVTVRFTLNKEKKMV
jgi:TonB family protein